VSARDSTIKTNTARSHIEKATREAACQSHRKAVVHYVKAAELFEDTGHNLEAERAWRRAFEHAQKRSWQLAQRPKFSA
jgi:hypothetical protein